MAEIENIHCPICTQPIPSSWQNALPPALATDERRGASASCRVAQVPPIIGESVKVDAATFLASIDLFLA